VPEANDNAITPAAGAQPHGPAHAAIHTPHVQATIARRDLFWQNVVRETLMALAVAAGSGGRLSPTPTGAATSPEPVGPLFDGRMAVVTTLGQRIPIADIYPVFACSVARGTQADRMLAADVQCSVFQIKTPTGEIYTLPLSQVASVHALTDELIRQLEQQAAASAARSMPPQGSDLPFGFAAFTSLARSESEPED